MHNELRLLSLIFIGRAARFYETSAGPNLLRLESVKYPGQYIIVKNGKLRIGVPFNDNDIFELDHLQRSGLFALRLAKSKDCYMAFNEDGKRLDACGLSTANTGIWLTKGIV